jgi:hypothetical protein
MKLPILCLPIILMMLVIPAYSLFESTSPDQYIAKYNSNLDKAPAPLKSLIGNERVEFEIGLNNGSQYKLGLETNNGQVIRTVKGVIENPSIEIQTRENVIQSVSSSSDPIAAFKQAKEAGNITITGTNFLSNLKVNAALASMDLLKSFYGVIFGQT